MKSNITKAIHSVGRILDVWIPRKIEYDHIPGLSLGITYQGELLFRRGYGYADREKKIKASPDTCYRVASITKIFTAIALLQLRERGKLSLDDPVKKFLPWFKAKSKAGSTDRITIRQFLTHSAGIFRDGEISGWATRKFPKLSDLKRWMTPQAVVFKNRTRFKYSNFGYAILGEVIREVSGIPYEEYIARHIFRKVGMKNSSLRLEDTNLRNLASGYGVVLPGMKQKKTPHAETNAFVPAGGLITNVTDLAKLYYVLSPRYAKQYPLLRKESRREMLRKVWDTGEENRWYGIGLNITKIKKRKIIGHGGGFPGFITEVSFDFDNEIGVIVLTNSSEGRTRSLTQSIFDAIRNFTADRKFRITSSPVNTLRRYEGIYRCHWGEIGIAALPRSLIAFDIENRQLMKEAAFFIPLRINEFLIEEKNSFGSPGEKAVFQVPKRGGKVHFMYGATPFDKI